MVNRESVNLTWSHRVAEKFSKKGLNLHPKSVEMLSCLEDGIDPNNVNYQAKGENRQSGTRPYGFVVLKTLGTKVRLDTAYDRSGTYGLVITDFPGGILWIEPQDRDIRTPEGGGLLYGLFSTELGMYNRFRNGGKN